MKSVKLKNKTSNNFNVAQIFQNWKSPIIGRKELCDLSGGMINIHTLRALDSHGKGIPGKFRSSPHTVVYPLDQAILWLENRIAKCNGENKEKGGSNEHN